jgi:alpha-galactosidase/6-phospho-beta-glucosidase family protein
MTSPVASNIKIWLIGAGSFVFGPTVLHDAIMEHRLNGVRLALVDPRLELASRSVGLKPKSVVEEMVTELSGEIEIPVGKQEMMFIPRNMVDGKLDKVGIGQ